MAPADSSARDIRRRTIVVVTSGWRHAIDGGPFLYPEENAAVREAISTIQQHNFEGPIAVAVPVGCHPSVLEIAQLLAEALSGDGDEVLRPRREFVRRTAAMFDLDQIGGIKASIIVTVQMALPSEPDDTCTIASPLGAVHAYVIEHDRSLGSSNHITIRIDRLT